MKTNFVKFLNLLFLLLNLNVFAQSKYEAPTLSAGLDNIAFNKGTLDVELLMDIIKEKQKELVEEGVKRFLTDKIIKADDFYTQFYLERVISILFEEKNYQVITKKILEETTNYLFILGTSEFVLNSDIADNLSFINIEKPITSNKKFKLASLSKSKKERLIYLVFYICKDIDIIKELGLLNNLNYFELESASKQKDFENIRIAIDYIFGFKEIITKNINKNETNEENINRIVNSIISNITLSDYEKINALFKMFDISLFKDPIKEEEFVTFFSKLNNATEKIKTFKENIEKQLNETTISLNVTQSNYKQLKKILNILNVTILNKEDETKLLNFLKNTNSHKSEIKKLKNKIILNVESFKRKLNNINSLKDLFFLFDKTNIIELKKVLKSYNIVLFDQTTEDKIFKYLKDIKVLEKEFVRIIKTVTNITKLDFSNISDIDKLNFTNIVNITKFIESLLNNHDVLKDVINITGLNRNKNDKTENLYDELFEHYDKIFNEYKIDDLLTINKSKELKEHLKYIDGKIITLDLIKTNINEINNGKKVWRKFKELIPKNNKIKEVDLNLLGAYKDKIKDVIVEYNKLIIEVEKAKKFKENLKKIYDVENVGTRINNDEIETINFQSKITSIKQSLGTINDINLGEKIDYEKIITPIRNIYLLSKSLNEMDKLSEKYTVLTNKLSELEKDQKQNPNTTSIHKEELIILLKTFNKNDEMLRTIDIAINNASETAQTLKTLSDLIKKESETKLSNIYETDNLNKFYSIIKTKIINIKNKPIVNYLSELKIKIQDEIKGIPVSNIDNLAKLTIDKKLHDKFEKIVLDYKKLKNDITIHYLKKEDKSLFEIIRTSIKEVKIDFEKLDSTDVNVIKKFNRILSKRNLLYNLKGLELVKELDDNLMSDLNIINLKLKDNSNSTEKDSVNTFSKILKTTEFALSVLIRDEIINLNDTSDKSQSILNNENLTKFVEFIKFISNIKELNKAETFSFLLKTMSNYKELFNLKDDSSLVDIVNSIRTYSIINNEKNVIEIDAASVLTHFTEKYINSDKSRFKFYATVGVNQYSIPNYKNIEGVNSKSFSSASEKIGVKFNLWDFTRDNYRETKMIHQVKRKPFVSNIYTMAYASGVLYKIANTTDNGFESANAGVAFGLSFFNSLDFNLSVAVPLEGDAFKNYFFGFSFDIPLSEYLSRL